MRVLCCAYNKHVCHLQYFVLVVLIFIIEIVAGVLAFTYRHEIENFLSKELLTGIRHHYPNASQPDTEGLRSAWGFLQTKVSICILL